jgi:hypothetical protein
MHTCSILVAASSQLSPKTDKSGAQIVNYLLKAVEDNRDKIVVIVAGYADQACGCSSAAWPPLHDASSASCADSPPFRARRRWTSYLRSILDCLVGSRITSCSMTLVRFSGRFCTPTVRFHTLG